MVWKTKENHGNRRWVSQKPSRNSNRLHLRSKCKCCGLSLHKPAHERTIQDKLHTQFFYIELRYVVLPFLYPGGRHVVYTGHKRRATCILVTTSEFMLSKQGPAVTLLTNRLNIQKFYQQTAGVFLRTWQKTAIISLYSINLLVFIKETESIYCAVRTTSLKAVFLLSFQRTRQL